MGDFIQEAISELDGRKLLLISSAQNSSVGLGMNQTRADPP